MHTRWTSVHDPGFSHLWPKIPTGSKVLFCQLALHSGLQMNKNTMWRNCEHFISLACLQHTFRTSTMKTWRTHCLNANNGQLLLPALPTWRCRPAVQMQAIFRFVSACPTYHRFQDLPPTLSDVQIAPEQTSAKGTCFSTSTHCVHGIYTITHASLKVGHDCSCSWFGTACRRKAHFGVAPSAQWNCVTLSSPMPFSVPGNLILKFSFQ